MRPLPEAQQAALVAALRATAAGMAGDARFERCGAASLACLVQPGCVTAAWAGDCRAWGSAWQRPVAPSCSCTP